MRYLKNTDKEWELWFENQNNQEKNFLLKKLSLRRFVIIGNKCILTNGTYVKPRVEMVAEFRNEDLLIEFKMKVDKIYE